MAAWQWGLMHALVDAACAASVMAHYQFSGLPETALWWLIVTYNALAFGLQPLFGLVADWPRVQQPKDAGRGMASELRARAAAEDWDRWLAISGLLLTGLAAVAGCWSGWAAVVAAGLGNALFHVGAGAIVLSDHPGRATEPGIFVAPGAVGLAAGISLGGAGFPHRWLILAAIACAAAWVRWGSRRRPRSAETVPQAAMPLPLMAAAVLLLVSVSLRGWLGDALAQGSRGVAAAAWTLAAAAMLGKLCGGLIADRCGWRLAGVGALLALAVSVSVFPPDRVAAAAVSMLLLQLTMPVTLAGLSEALPHLPGTAFGLASLALWIPSALAALGWLHADHAIGPAIAALISAAAIGLGLTLVAPNRKRGHDSSPHHEALV